MGRGITIPYLTGFDVKPSSTSPIGVVTFTDGTNDILTTKQMELAQYLDLIQT